MDQIIHHLKNSDYVLLATHINPDGDAIGSLVAMGLFLSALNKETTLYSESPIPVMYSSLLPTGHIVRQIDEASIYDTAIILDCSDLQRIGKAASIVNQIPVIINIDHHATNNYFGDFQLIDTSACATVEIIYRLLKKMAIPIDRSMATAIYTGILADTGSFRFSNTNRSAFAICEEMVALGVDPRNVAQHLYEVYPISRIKLLSLALGSIEISHNSKLSMMSLTKEMIDKTGTRPEDINGIINYAKGIEGVRVAALILELKDDRAGSKRLNHFHVSLRSDGTVDVAKIATSFGGGGHCNAAGFGIKSTMSDLKNRLFDLAEKL